jgi:hypothetical protein
LKQRSEEALYHGNEYIAFRPGHTTPAQRPDQGTQSYRQRNRQSVSYNPKEVQSLELVRAVLGHQPLQF